MALICYCRRKEETADWGITLNNEQVLLVSETATERSTAPQHWHPSLNFLTFWQTTVCRTPVRYDGSWVRVVVCDLLFCCCWRCPRLSNRKRRLFVPTMPSQRKCFETNCVRSKTIGPKVNIKLIIISFFSHSYINACFLLVIEKEFACTPLDFFIILDILFLFAASVLG